MQNSEVKRRVAVHPAQSESENKVKELEGFFFQLEPMSRSAFKIREDSLKSLKVNKMRLMKKLGSHIHNILYIRSREG